MDKRQAMFKIGINELLDAISSFIRPPASVSNRLSAYLYKIEHEMCIRDREETQPKVAATPAATDAQVEAVATSLFPDIEAEKPKEEVVDLSPVSYTHLLPPSL